MTHRKRERVAAIHRQVEDTSRRPSKAPAVGPEEQSATATVSQMNMSFARVPVSTEQARPAIQRTPEEDAKAALRAGMLTRKFTDWKTEIGMMMTDGQLQQLTPEDRQMFSAVRAQITDFPHHRSTAPVKHGVRRGDYTGKLETHNNMPAVAAENAVGVTIDPLDDNVAFWSELAQTDGGTNPNRPYQPLRTPAARQTAMTNWETMVRGEDPSVYPFCIAPAYSEVRAAFEIQSISAVFLSSNRERRQAASIEDEARQLQTVLNTLGHPVPIWELIDERDGNNSRYPPTIRVLAPAPAPIRPSDGSSSSTAATEPALQADGASSSNAATHADASSSSPQTVGSSSAFIDSPAPPLVVPPNMLSDADDSFAPPPAAQFGRSRRTGF